jgi:hypothetical protein
MTLKLPADPSEARQELELFREIRVYIYSVQRRYFLYFIYRHYQRPQCALLSREEG